MKLKGFRELKNLSRREVAERTGISIQSLERYENGKSEPNIKTLKRLSKFYNVSIDSIVGNNSNSLDLNALEENKRKIIETIAYKLNDEQVNKLEGVMLMIDKI